MRRPGETICWCCRVRVCDVENAVQAGARTLEEVCRQTGAASGCTKCRNTVLSVLNGILKAKQNE